MSQNIKYTATDIPDIAKIRNDFPVLHQEVHGKRLVYFDNAATNQKPKVVIDALTDYYQHFNANIHRGIHTLAEKATSAFENTRRTVQRFINADEPEEIIFTTGTTDGINLIASSYGRPFVQQGDEIIISTLEHHSNIVPWQLLCEEKGAVLKVIPLNDKGEIILEEYKKLLSERTKIVSVAHVSNTLGTISPVKEIIDLAHQLGAITVIDGAQAAAHLDIDVRNLKCDFYVFSAHKIFGPTGVGILYGKRKILESMVPYRAGGEMINEVRFEKTTFNEIPYKFEAGTPNIADVIAFDTAIKYVNKLSKEVIREQEGNLLAYATEALSSIPQVRIIGSSSNKTGVISFVVDGLHHFDIGMMLDAKGIAVRTGHHCTQPLMDWLGVEGTVRASFSVYNSIEEVDIFIDSLKNIIEKWK